MMELSPQPSFLTRGTDLEVYQTLFDCMPCIVSVQDREFRIIKVNRSFEAEFGRRIGEHCFSVYKGRDGICPNCSVEKTFRDGQVHHSEETVFKQDGQEATIVVTTSPVLDADHNVAAAIEMSLDITGLRHLQALLRTSEERYRALFNNQANPIFVVSLDNDSIVDANDTALAEYGYVREELLARHFLGLVPESERGRMERSIAQRKRRVLKIPQLRRDGSVMMTNVRIAYPENAVPGRAIVTVSDITEQVKIEQQLAQASKLATLGEMSAGIAHELNQPLSVIKSASTFLRFLAKKVIEKGAPQQGEGAAAVTIQADALKSLTDEIDSHVDRASRIIRHLRDFGRQSDLSRERVDLNEGIRRAFLLMGTQLQGRGISYHLQLEERLPPVLAEMSRVEQVFINLILNARDAIQERERDRKGPREEMGIFVRTFLDGDRVAVAFRDTGCGIPEEILGKIFDPFFTTKEVGEGTGLGLSISYGIIQDYGGKIQAESVVGKGTIFTIWFPAAPSRG